MAKRYLTISAEDTLCITEIINNDDEEADADLVAAKVENKLTKTLFELSRTTDLEIHFDASIHTREAIAAGLDGHRPLSLLAECEDTDLPNDDYFRNAWEWED